MQKMTKMKSKILAGILVFLLVFSDFAFVGKTAVTYAMETLQTFTLFEDSVGTGHENVEFDAYFKDNLDTEVLSQVNDIQNSDAKMYVAINVKDAGYLKDAKVEFTSKNGDELNFKFKEIEQDEFAQNIENSTLNVNQINYGSDVEIKLPFEYEKEEYIKLSKLNQDVIAKFSGTYVTNDGEDVKVEKEVTLNFGWTADMHISVSSSLTKYVPFDINGNRGLIVQTLVESQVLNENNLPIKTSTLEVGAPEIKGYYPSKVVVTAQSTEGTNGKKDELVIFGQDNWSYDEESKVTKISVKNEVLENGTYYSNGGTDEFLMTYTYPSEVLDIIGTETVGIISRVVGKIERYSNNETKMNETEKTDGYELVKLGDIVTYSIERDDNLNKGLIYANYNNEEHIYETEIKSKQIINIAYKDIISELRISDISETFKNREGNLYDASDIYYKTTIINKNNMKSILGEDGFIEIKNQNGDVLAKFDKNTSTDDLENMTFNYGENKLNKIVIQTSKPTADGNLIIDNVKAIKDFSYSKQDFRSFESLITKSNLQAKYELTEDFSEVQVIEKEINLAETITDAELAIDKESLSTLTPNTDVELRITLNNDEVTSDLYENPVFEIVFPEEITDVRIKNANILYGEGLEIQSANSYKDGNNYKLKVKLQGTQKKFSEGTLTDGTNIIVTADIDVETYTPATTDEIVMYYMNENVTRYVSSVNWKIDESIPKGILSLENGYDAVVISYAAPTGMVAVTNLSNYNKDFDEVSSINEGRKDGKLEIYTNEKQANAELIIMNNNQNICKDITILGRFPSQGTKSIVTGEDLESTHDAKLLGAIEQNAQNKVGFDIYYSTHVNATKDLDNPANEWTKDVADFSTIKSYLMIASGYEMQTGDILRFNYRFEVPANLEHNTTICGTYAVYFNNITKDAAIYETKEADIVGLSTGEGPQFDIVVSSNMGDDDFSENQIVEYKVKATNTGKATAKDVVFTAFIPEGTTYVVANGGADKSTQYKDGYKENPTVNDIKIEEYDVEPGETLEIKYQVRVGSIPNSVAAIYGEGALEDGEGVFKYKDFLVIYKETTPENKEEGTEAVYEEISREETTLTEVDMEVKTNENGEKIKQEIVREKYYLTDADKIEYKIQAKATIKARDLEKEIPSNTQENVVTESYLKMGLSSYQVTEEVLPGSEFIIYVHVQNLTRDELKDVQIEYDVPEAFEIKDAYSNRSDELNINVVGNSIRCTIPTITDSATEDLTVKVKVKEMSNPREAIYVNNIAYGRVNNTLSISNNLTYTVAQPVISIVLRSDSSQYLKEEDTIRYIATIKNEGLIAANYVKFEDVLPSELIIKKAEYQTNEGTVRIPTQGNRIQFSEGLYPGESMEVRIEAEVGNLNKKPGDTTEITNFATADGVESNNITTIVEQVKESKPNSQNQSSSSNTTENGFNSSNTNSQRNTITGLAWLDTNKDGRRDISEGFVKDVKVSLINTQTEKTVATTVTKENGIYIFNNIDMGFYVIVFEYDSIRYGVTTYRVSGVPEIENSDAIVTKIEKDDIKVNAAITDSIALSSNNVSNVDIGLIKADIFDLSINETVTKITTKTAKETTEIEVNHSKLAKTDIHSKLIDGAEVVIEYTISVKNEGEVAGTASRLVSYLSSGLQLDDELNPEWSIGSDGNAYTSTLENEIIQPGETKEIKLYLSKVMTGSNTGLVNNATEIKEDYNIYGISDIDSVAGNRSQKEDDISSADTIITPGTGVERAILPIVLGGIVIAGVIAIIAYEIKKKSVPSNKRRWV